MTETSIAVPPPPPPVPSAPPATPPSRSALVTASGVVVAILPSALIAAVLVMMPDTAPVWSMFARGDIGELVATAVFLVVLGLVMLAGIAIANRWRGWRYYAGTLGWLSVVMACFFVNDYLERLDFEPFFASASDPRPIVAVAAAFALLGIFLLVAKRDEPPPQPARPMTAIGVAVIVSGLAMLAGAVATMIFAPDRATGGAVPIVIGGLVALMGYGIAGRVAGWRIYSGTLAWFLIVVGAANGVVEFPPSYASRYASRLWMHAMVTAMCIGFGWFILWSKRREPRPAREAKQAVPVESVTSDPSSTSPAPRS